jgi:peptide/nickel transport system permease protein
VSQTPSARDKELSLMQHLGELRSRLMVASFGVLIATGAAFFFAKDIILALEAPAHLGKPLQIISPTEGFTTQEPLGTVIAQASVRSLALLAGVTVFSLFVGVLLGIAAALVRRRAIASGAVLGVTSVAAAIPSFFLAYFLQILFIFIGGAAGHTVLPVFGYGLDSHLVLPLLALSAPAVATTAQLTAVRMGEVFDADFITTANAKGLLPSWIIRVHVLPHVLPVSLEAVGSGLRVAVASLPIVEYILLWNGIGFVALQSIALRDPVALTACAIVLGSLFTLTSLLLDLRPTR